MGCQESQRQRSLPHHRQRRSSPSKSDYLAQWHSAKKNDSSGWDKNLKERESNPTNQEMQIWGMDILLQSGDGTEKE